MRGIRDHIADVEAELKEGRKRRVVTDCTETAKKALSDLRRQLDAVDAIKGFRVVTSGGRLAAEMTVTVGDAALNRVITECARAHRTTLELD